jgi:hypothetical protein
VWTVRLWSALAVAAPLLAMVLRELIVARRDSARST